MNPVRWLFLGLVYLATELGCPLGAVGLEAQDGEAEERITVAAEHRPRRLAAGCRTPASRRTRPIARVPRRILAARRLRLAAGGPGRRIRAALPERVPTADDH